jgi:TetR/AcrR family tetracycline transcriptional repressor
MPLLHRADVVDGAVELLDAEGLDGLTTRKLGASLNVDGSALYRHFPNKEALLEAIADRLVESIDRSLPEGPWDEQLAVLAGRLREALLAHRDGARVVAGTYVTGPNTLLVGNVIFEILQRAGFPPERAGWIVFALNYYVLGHTIEEQAQAELAASRAWKAKLTEMVDRADNSYIATAVTATFDADPVDRFTYGLQAFLDGFRRQLDEPAPAAAGRGDEDLRARQELLPAVDVVGRPGDSRVDHQVHRQPGDVGRLDHPPDGQLGAELGAARVQVTAEQPGRQPRVNKAGRDEVDPDRRHLDRQAGDQGGQRGAERGHERQAGAPGAGTAHEQQRATGPHPADGMPGHLDGQPQVPVEIADRPRVVEVGQGRVVRAGAGHQHVVNRSRQAGEELPEGGRVGGVEGRDLARADIGRGLLEVLGVPAGEDDLRALLAGAAGGFQAYAGAAADHEDGLPAQFRFARHDVTSTRLVLASTLACRRPARARDKPWPVPGLWYRRPGPRPIIGLCGRVSGW